MKKNKSVFTRIEWIVIVAICAMPIIITICTVLL